MNYHRQGNTIHSFCEIECSDFIRQLTEKIHNEIENKGKDYILRVDEEEFKNYIINEYTLEPLFVDIDSEIIDKPIVTTESIQTREYGRGSYQTEVYSFTVRYQFTGSAILFRVRPTNWKMTSGEINVNEGSNTVSFSFKLTRKDPEEFKRTKNNLYSSAFANLQNANYHVKSWNDNIAGTFTRFFQNQKNKYLQENDFFTAINVKVNKDTTSVFTAPTIKKKIIPQPVISNKIEFASQPMMAKEMYDDILKVIYDLGKSMEKKPSTYKNKDEEGLRDQFLLVLETRYEGTTASGETFNRNGKTDIILKYANDGSNLFVAECKFWHGEVEFIKAISQLFDRYLTWRDSKAALILFVKNKDFSNVMQTICKEIKNHPYYIKENGKRGETSLSYIFHLQQDNDKVVHFEVICFHFE